MEMLAVLGLILGYILGFILGAIIGTGLALLILNIGPVYYFIIGKKGGIE